MGSIGNNSSNSKYNGFSITNPEGKTENYRVINGRVEFANGQSGNFFGIDYLSTMQKAYDTNGSVQALIDRVNSIGKGSARSLSDTEVQNMINERDKERAERREQAIKEDAQRNRGKDVNRHRAYWSGM